MIINIRKETTVVLLHHALVLGQQEAAKRGVDYHDGKNARFGSAIAYLRHTATIDGLDYNTACGPRVPDKDYMPRFIAIMAEIARVYPFLKDMAASQVERKKDAKGWR